MILHLGLRLGIRDIIEFSSSFGLGKSWFSSILLIIISHSCRAEWKIASHLCILIGIVRKRFSICSCLLSTLGKYSISLKIGLDAGPNPYLKLTEPRPLIIVYKYPLHTTGLQYLEIVPHKLDRPVFMWM